MRLRPQVACNPRKAMQLIAEADDMEEATRRAREMDSAHIVLFAHAAPVDESKDDVRPSASDDLPCRPCHSVTQLCLTSLGVFLHESYLF